MSSNSRPSAHIRIKKVSPNAKLPEQMTNLSAGFDLSASEDISLGPGSRCLVPTGIAVAIPAGYEGQVRPRSGMAWKRGITVLNSPGTIDADYRGEVKVILLNTTDSRIHIPSGERIAQLVINQIPEVTLELVAELEDTDRGAGGFGSTGSA